MILIEDNFEDDSQEGQKRLARKLLSNGLLTKYGISKMPHWDYGAQGKPFFKDYPDIHFNISHCKKAVVCALSVEPIGIDVECIEEYDDDLAKYIASPEEYQSITGNSNKGLAFAVLWTQKESYLKLSGEGLIDRKKIQSILIENNCNFHTVINESKGYVVTTCKYN